MTFASVGCPKSRVSRVRRSSVPSLKRSRSVLATSHNTMHNTFSELGGPRLRVLRRKFAPSIASLPPSSAQAPQPSLDPPPHVRSRASPLQILRRNPTSPIPVSYTHLDVYKRQPFTFIGYREILARYSGELKRDPAELKLEETILEIQKATRQFAKRQLTWFRKEPNVHWLETFGDDPSADTQALALL